MEDWWCDEERKLKQGEWLIHVQEFKRPYKMINTMICRLYGEEKSTHFHMEWLSMYYTIVNMG